MAASKTKTNIRPQALELPGRPDFVFDDARVAVMAHGCFWHGCPSHWKIPLAKPGFWRKKMLKNRRRDVLVQEKLEDLGWKVFTVWEHDNLDLAAARILFAVRERLTED